MAYEPGVDSKRVCKRIAGLAGDLVYEISGKITRVPKGAFWAEGDNKMESKDSRQYGPVPLSNLRFLVEADEIRGD